MAKSNRRPTVPSPLPAPPADERPGEGFVPAASFGDADAPAKGEPPAEKVPAPASDPRDAEIERLRAELAALKGAGAALPGGKFTVAWRDGPTLTIAVRPGETPLDALSRYGVHSTPHKIEVDEAPADAVLGQHLPNGGVRPFVAPAKE